MSSSSEEIVENFGEIRQDEILEQKLPLKESKIDESIREKEVGRSQSGDSYGKLATFIAITSILAAFTCHILVDSNSANETKIIPRDDSMKELVLDNVSFPRQDEKLDCGLSSYEVYSNCVSELMEEAKVKLEFLKLKNSIASTDYQRALEIALKKYVSNSLAFEGAKLNEVNFDQLKNASIAALKIRLGSLSVENILSIHKNATHLTERDDAGKLRRRVPNIELEYLKIASPDEIHFLLKEYVEWFNNEISMGKNELLLAAMAKLIFVQIHPFENGNERISQIILNYILVNRGYPWVIIPAYEVNEYNDAIKHVHKDGDMTPYFVYILKCILGSLNLFISDLNLET